MVECVGNSDARGNLSHGALIYRKGITDPIEVYKAHLWWARGVAADFWLERGYREAAEADGKPVGEALRLFHPLCSEANRELRRDLHMRRLDFPCPY